MKLTRFLLFLFFHTFSLLTSAQTKNLIDKVYLIGNFADVENTDELKRDLSPLIQQKEIPYLIILSGDIVKTDLNKEKNYLSELEKIKNFVQITQVNPNGKIVFVPGDRDWDNSGKDGLKNVEKLEKLVKSINNEAIIFDPDDGCPGPKVKEVGNSLSLINISTQWFNHPYDRPRDTEAECKYTSDVDFIEEFSDAISETRGRNVIIAGHYPILSNGIFGGRTPMSWHLAPVVGTFYAAYRKNIGNNKDIVNKRFENIRHKMLKTLADEESIVYTAGHEYNLEVLQKGENIFINSGSYEKNGIVKKDTTTLFKSAEKGFVAIHYYDNGDISTITYVRDEGKLSTVDERTVMKGLCNSENSAELLNKKYTVCLKKIKKTTPSARNGNKTVIANKNYAATGFKKFMLGERYRKSWTTEISVPILDLKNTKGGLTPYKLGGGRQTTSIKFKGGDGRTYTFRSVDKDLSPVIPIDLRQSGASDLVNDQTTGQQPYGAMAAGVMLNELNIPHAHPKLYVLPDDPALGVWQKEFAGMLGMLEEDPKDWENDKLAGFYGADDVEKSFELFHHLYEDHNNTVDAKMLAKARIFDIFVGDWGKHQDNWKWAEYKKEEGSLYRPIPRDRDHVFSKWDGVIPYLYSREWAAGNLARFNGKIENIETFVWPARELDRLLLTELSEKDWVLATDTILAAMTDDVIHSAVLSMPKEIYEEDGKEIEMALLKRKEVLKKRIQHYYRFLAEEVDVVGSNKAEYFEVNRNEDGSVLVRMYELKNGQKNPNKLLFSRLFLNAETEEIRLFGLGENDVFEVKGESDESIFIRIVPGPGTDQVTDNSKVKGLKKYTYVYEKSDEAKLSLGSEATVKSPWNDNLYYYNRSEFKYDSYSPVPTIYYNGDDGLGLGFGISFTKKQWGKQAYKSKHSISGDISTKGFYHFKLENRFRHVIRKWDFLLNTIYNAPGRVHFFYGYGTNTTLNDSLYDANFYQVRRTSVLFSSGFGRQFLRQSEFQATLRYENNKQNLLDSNILSTVNVIGKEPYSAAEGFFLLDLDFRDNKAFPENGARFFSTYLYGTPVGNKSIETVSDYQIFTSSIEYFTTTRTAYFPVTFGLKTGYEIASSSTPFYKMPNVGLTNHLKGFRRNRFSANQITYLNGEVRLHLFNLPKAFLPLKFGITGFYDIADIKTSEKLGGGENMLDSYGGGFYLVPWNKSFTLSVSAGFSEEEKGLFVIGIGSLINKGERGE